MITVDAMGDNCPIPVIKTKKAMEALTAPDAIEVLVDNEIAVQNVSKMAESAGGTVAVEKIEDGQYRILIQAGGAADAKELQAESKASVPNDDTAVVFTSDRMGSGNDDLGKVLVKGCIFAITQLDVLPKTMIFYNGGATLTAEGSDSLEDLKHLEEQGVEILTCGTCLDYYGLKEKLAVGTVTNMYTIVETLSKAGKIINP